MLECGPHRRWYRRGIAAHAKIGYCLAVENNDAADTGDGCPSCNRSKDGLNVVHKELRELAFERITFYQYDELLVCPACGDHWLSQYWEIDTPETALEEFGERYRNWTRVSPQGVQLIEETIKSGELLRHDHFM